MRATILAAALAAALVHSAWTPGTAESHDDVEGVVGERHDLMKGLGQSMRTVKGYLTGRASVDEALAAVLSIRHASDAMLPLFPAGTGMDDVAGSEALGAVWENWDGFTMAAALLGERAAALEAALESGDGDAADSAFGLLGRDGCGGCHGLFRHKN